MIRYVYPVEGSKEGGVSMVRGTATSMQRWRMEAPLIEWTERGLYCSAGGFYIDPRRAVATAVITHAHSDHARRGCHRYICAERGTALLKCRLGQTIDVTSVAYRQSFRLGDVDVSFHSAGHILGSAQVRVQHRSEVWVVSGDYKRELDPSCDPFDVVECDTFITEATFGTPKYVWQGERDHGAEIYSWWQQNAVHGKNSVLFAYSLGKAQRILALLAPFADRPVIVHPSIDALNECYRDEGCVLARTRSLDANEADASMKGELILLPPSVQHAKWLGALRGDFERAFASGWMVGTSGPNRGGYDRGFVLSDHADWKAINRTIVETKARRVFALHRNDGALVRHLQKQGLDAYSVSSLIPQNYQRIKPYNLDLFR